MSDDVQPALDGLAEIKGTDPVGYRVPSTTETQARWQLLKSKRTGQTAPAPVEAPRQERQEYRPPLR